MNKIPEYKVCAAALRVAIEPPAWAADVDPALLDVANKRRHELPSASAKPKPTFE